MKEGQSKNLGKSYYGQMVNDDIVSKLAPILQSGGYNLRLADGKICATFQGYGWDTPWHHIQSDVFLDCNTWHRVMFDMFSRTLPKERQFVPSCCQQCWKVVVRPKTLLGLFALLHLQIKMDRPSKCGAEIRESVHGLYGGYFYNHSLQEGLACYEAVRKNVDETMNLGPEIVVLLKRSCTEFEMLCGPSDKWEISEEQVRIETLVNKWFVRDHTMLEQPQNVVSRVHRRWIEWAYMNGDATYLNFTEGEPLYSPYVTYHHLIESGKKTELKKSLVKFSRKPNFGYDY